jgi:CheY-like chemotaxis protein/HPt (histidine-containing phosphotransfer) domain-containing protein
MIEDVVQLSRVLGGPKGLQIHSRISPEIPPLVLGDAHRLRQVLTNLAGNAIKFTKQGQVTLAAAVDTGQQNGKLTIRFSVTDTGIGLRPDQVAGLFSPFVQADSSTTRKYGGTGLGLSICKQIAGLMGGTIGVDSHEGQGSTFWFTAVFGVELPSQQAPASGKPVGRTRVRTDARILVAEDDPTNREVALAQLRKLGYNATAVTNGVEAIEALQQGRYDLVLMDCEMPEMDGVQATRVICATMPSVPIIALSADVTQSNRDRCLSGGMNDFLSKPTDMGQLANAIAKWLPVSSAETDTTSGPLTGEEPAAPVQDVPAAFIFDAEDLLQRLMGDRKLARIVVQGFLKDVPSQLSGLCKRLDERHAAGVRLQAHNLKGASGTAAAKGLHAVAEAMERAGEAGQLDRCRELLPRAVEEFQRYKSAVERAGWSEDKDIE